MWDVQVDMYAGRQCATPVPGYMRSTLSTPGPCARPSSSSGTFYDSCDSPTESTDGLPKRANMTSPTATSQSVTRPVTSGGRVVSLCDWSHGHCCPSTPATHRSLSSLSEKVQRVPVISTDQSSKRARLKQWRGGGRDGLGGTHLLNRHQMVTLMGPAPSRVDGSRMFLRQKTHTTKGEKEIMMGICQNRGDLPPVPYTGCTDCMVNMSGIVSHQHAWSLGKGPPIRSFPSVSVNGIHPLSRPQNGSVLTRSIYIDKTLPPGEKIQSEEQATDSFLRCVTPRHSNKDKKRRVVSNRNISKDRSSLASTPITSPRDQGRGLDKEFQMTPRAMPIIAKPVNTVPKPKLLLNVHLPRVPSTVKGSEDQDADLITEEMFGSS